MRFRAQNRKYVIWSTLFGIFIVAVMAVGTIRIGFTRSFTIVVGTSLILFFPGWWASFVAFPLHDRLGDETNEASNRTLDSIERMTLAVALSIVLYSATVFVLYNFPGGGELNFEDFAIATVLLNTTLFALAGWRKKWIHRSLTVALGLFPLIVIVVNQVFAVAITARNFVIEVSFLLLVLLIIRVVMPRP